MAVVTCLLISPRDVLIEEGGHKETFVWEVVS